MVKRFAPCYVEHCTNPSAKSCFGETMRQIRCIEMSLAVLGQRMRQLHTSTTVCTEYDAVSAEVVRACQRAEPLLSSCHENASEATGVRIDSTHPVVSEPTQ